MSEISFETVDVPRRPGRPPLPNPYVKAVRDLIDDASGRDKALSFVMNDDELSTAVNRVRRQLYEAGIANGVSVHRDIHPNPTGGTRVTFWVMPKPSRVVEVSDGDNAETGESNE